MISFTKLLSSPTPAIGMFIQSASPEFLEASGYAGFQFAAIDLEHASYGTETLVSLIRAGEAAGLSMLARVPGLDAALIKKSLDMGAAGIIIPNIDTPEQAAEAPAPVSEPTAMGPADRSIMRRRTVRRSSFL